MCVRVPTEKGPLGKASAELTRLADKSWPRFQPQGRVLPRELFHRSLKGRIIGLPGISTDAHRTRTHVPDLGTFRHIPNSVICEPYWKISCLYPEAHTARLAKMYTEPI